MSNIKKYLPWLGLCIILIGIWVYQSNEKNLKIEREDQVLKELEIEDLELKTQKEKEQRELEVMSSVVNILCPADGEDIWGDNLSGGSGTIIDESGIIITNSHIIPQDDEYIYVSAQGCLVSLPDPEVGTPNEVYWAEPLILNEISDAYDLAFLTITEPFIDEDGSSYGVYPKVFPTFQESESCSEGYFKLGESLRIIGYPLVSGGFNLTITEGVISSLGEDGFIYTSAKIDEGNSGGLAVSEEGCWVGVPTAVNLGTYENLGIIIPVNTLSDFIEEALLMAE